MKKIKQVRIEETAWQRAKGAAALKGMTLGDWLTALIDSQLAAEKSLAGWSDEDIKAIKEQIARENEAVGFKTAR